MIAKVTFTFHLLVKLLILSATYFMSGCGVSTIKHYNYTESSKEFDWGKIVVKLEGEYKTVSNSEEIYSVPYRLKVFFIGENLKGCSVSIDEITLKNLKGEPVLSKKVVSKNITWSNIHNNTRVSFIFDKINIAYVDYSFTIKGTLAGCLNKNFDESLHIKKNYHEEKVTIWDKLMGI